MAKKIESMTTMLTTMKTASSSPSNTTPGISELLYKWSLQLKLNRSTLIKTINIIIGIFVISILDKIAHNVCPEFTLNSNGLARQLYPEIIGDYSLHPVRNNGRVVYRSKEMFFINQRHSYVYLYSFNPEEYVYHKDYEKFATGQNVWMVRFIEYIS